MGVSEIKQEKINSYKDLKVWQLGMSIAENIYKLTAKFSSEHKFGIAQQMQRSALSVPLNIAEGYSRDGTGEYLYFISVAMGSRSELETQLQLSVNVSLVSKNEVQNLFADLEILAKMLKKLSISLKNKTPNPKSNIPTPKLRSNQHA